MSAETDWGAVADSVYREFVEDERREKAQQHLEELQEEIERLRAELQNAAKAALDAVALSCEKEREADALRAEVEVYRKDAERYRWLRTDSAISAIPRVWSSDESAYPVTPLHLEFLDEAIDAAMGASA